MNKRQKEVLLSEAENEQELLEELKKVYEQARKNCSQRIRELSARQDMENLQSIVWQKQYQEALLKQLDAIIDDLQTKEFTSVSEYLTECYTNAFVGNMYDLHGQGIPLIIPIDQKQVVKAIQNESKLKDPLYNAFGNDMKLLKQKIKVDLSSGIASGKHWNDIATDIAKGIINPFASSYKNAIRIARTEGHRVQQSSRFDSMQEAKKHGADVVKQWDSTLDDRTRPTHQMLDGQIRELDEPFTVQGKEAMYPSDFGLPEEDINCRCCALQRAKWALDEDELQTLKDRAKYFNLDKSSDFEDFKQKYLNLPENADKLNIDTLHPESLAGAKLGKPMTFDEADTYHVNPNYGKEHGFSINCQSCVPTFEARLRGYNVEVLSNTKGSKLELLSRRTNLIWIDPSTGKHPEYIKNDALTTAKQYLPFVSETVKQGGRYSIQFSWKGRSRSGHIVNIDRTEDGQLRIKDNQRGEGEKSEWIGDKEVLSYLSRMKYVTTFRGNKYPIVPKLLRIDNMQFDEEFAKHIMKESKK